VLLAVIIEQIQKQALVRKEGFFPNFWFETDFTLGCTVCVVMVLQAMQG